STLRRSQFPGIHAARTRSERKGRIAGGYNPLFRYCRVGVVAAAVGGSSSGYREPGSCRGRDAASGVYAEIESNRNAGYASDVAVVAGGGLARRRETQDPMGWRS